MRIVEGVTGVRLYLFTKFGETLTYFDGYNTTAKSLLQKEVWSYVSSREKLF